MKADQLMTGDYAVVAKDGCLIPKGTIVKVLEVNSENECLELGLKGSAQCVPVSSKRAMPNFVWCDFLGPIPITPEILRNLGFIATYHPGTGATEETTEYTLDRLRVIHNTEDWRHECFYVQGFPCYELKWLHQLQHLMIGCGIELEIKI